ncbi:hypothetical protein WP50_21675, partial [Lactiplantibacillus plantarum]
MKSLKKCIWPRATLQVRGLAVVLQNDPRKMSAISRYGKKSIIGENLGVYGTDTYTRRTAPATIAKTAIQKKLG